MLTIYTIQAILFENMDYGLNLIFQEVYIQIVISKHVCRSLFVKEQTKLSFG